MRIETFDFALPAEAIAQHPARPRDAARLLCIGERLEDRRVRDLPRLLRPGDLLVLNDTKVMPTRLFGRRGDVSVEATLVEELAPGRWRALARPARRLRPGDRVEFASGFAAEVTSKNPDGTLLLDFGCAGEAMIEKLDAHGAAPLPPYIRRHAPDARDREDYQTVFAARPGAVAAPTAGTPLHARALGGAGCGGGAPHVDHATCRRRYFPAGKDGADRGSCHAYGTRPDLRRSGPRGRGV